MDKPKFTAGMKRLFAAHGRKFDESLADEYWHAMQKLIDNQFEYAIEKTLKTDETFPRIPKLLAYSYEVKRTSSAGPRSPSFSFLCKRCLLFFGVDFEKADPRYDYQCETCKYYYGQVTRWNVEFLRGTMQEAMDRGAGMAEV